IITRHPTCAITSQNGMITAIGLSWRPTVALNKCKSRLVIFANVTSGVPSEPNATGAVLAMSVSVAASSGRTPRPMSNAARSESREVRAHMKKSKEAKKCDHGQSRDERRDSETAEWRISLRPIHGGDE